MADAQLSPEVMARIARNKELAKARLQQSQRAKQSLQVPPNSQPEVSTNGPPQDASSAAPTSFQRKKRVIDLNYCEYNFSTMKDTKGGFILEEQQSDNIEAKKQKQNHHIDAALEHGLDPDARACKDAVPDKYSLLTKTECREDYLLTESELRDSSRLPHWIRPNPHKSTYSNMLLYLRLQVEAFAWEKWGGPEQLDAEFDRREKEKKDRKAKKFKAKLNELRKKTRTSTWTRATEVEHQHEYGEEEFDEGNNRYTKSCVSCGFQMSYEAL
ncbi:hypothetical protein HDV00_001234 [Rhizophlyctis rosea]|nr:hypothetical protein HDV00_001234 [Rhizophlyctis rosea]